VKERWALHGPRCWSGLCCEPPVRTLHRFRRTNPCGLRSTSRSPAGRNARQSEHKTHSEEIKKEIPLGGAWHVDDLSARTSAPLAAGAPVGYVRSDDVNALVHRGADGHIYEIALPLGGADWHIEDLSGRTDAPLAAGDPVGYVRSDNVNAVVYRGADDHIYEIALPLGGADWHVEDLSGRTDTPLAAGDPVVARH
jgi:hypothetical protein